MLYRGLIHVRLYALSIGIIIVTLSDLGGSFQRLSGSVSITVAYTKLIKKPLGLNDKKFSYCYLDTSDSVMAVDGLTLSVT